MAVVAAECLRGKRAAGRTVVIMGLRWKLLWLIRCGPWASDWVVGGRRCRAGVWGLAVADASVARMWLVLDAWITVVEERWQIVIVAEESHSAGPNGVPG